MTTIDAAAIATRVVELARNGQFAEIEALFAPQLRAVVSAETLRVGWLTLSGMNARECQAIYFANTKRTMPGDYYWCVRAFNDPQHWRSARQ